MSNYKGIVNNTFDRMYSVHRWCYLDNVFTADELNELNKQFENNNSAFTKGVVVDGEKTVKKQTRVSDIAFFGLDANTEWIFAKLNRAIDELNSRYYNFDLNGYDHFQLTQYNAEELGKYDLHMDMFLGNHMGSNKLCENRKLSLTLLLNDPETDFEGGEFEFVFGGEKPQTVPLKKGTIIVFPSFFLHRVNPVTKGTRRSLVVWVTGPKFK